MSVVEFSRALSSFVFYQHRVTAHLKKVKNNVDNLIKNLDGK